MKNRLFVLVAVVAALWAAPVRAEWMSIDGKPAQWGDIIQVRLRDIHPTQPSLGFDKIYYKLARYQHDRKKVFDDYCRKNGQKGVQDFSFDPDKSTLQDP